MLRILIVTIPVTERSFSRPIADYPRTWVAAFNWGDQTMKRVTQVQESSDERLAVFKNQPRLYREKVAEALDELRFALADYIEDDLRETEPAAVIEREHRYDSGSSSFPLIGVDMQSARRRRRATELLAFPVE